MYIKTQKQKKEKKTIKFRKKMKKKTLERVIYKTA